jgi:hypothetical protein
MCEFRAISYANGSNPSEAAVAGREFRTFKGIVKMALDKPLARYSDFGGHDVPLTGYLVFRFLQ